MFYGIIRLLTIKSVHSPTTLQSRSDLCVHVTLEGPLKKAIPLTVRCQKSKSFDNVNACGHCAKTVCHSGLFMTKQLNFRPHEKVHSGYKNLYTWETQMLSFCFPLFYRWGWGAWGNKWDKMGYFIYVLCYTFI